MLRLVCLLLKSFWPGRCRACQQLAYWGAGDFGDSVKSSVMAVWQISTDLSGIAPNFSSRSCYTWDMVCSAETNWDSPDPLSQRVALGQQGEKGRTEGHNCPGIAFSSPLSFFYKHVVKQLCFSQHCSQFNGMVVADFRATVDFWYLDIHNQVQTAFVTVAAPFSQCCD